MMRMQVSLMCPRCQSEHQLHPLTRKQYQIKAFLAEQIRTHGIAPSFEEIAEHFGYRSLGTVAEHLDRLERKGHIVRGHFESRSIQIVATPHETR